MSLLQINTERQTPKNSLQVQAEAEYEYRKRIVNEQQEHKNREQWEKEQEMRKFYQSHPIEWIVDRLGVPKEHIDWELLPQYKNHIWDGTRNPFKIVADALVANRWVAIEGATGVSKTFLAACFVLWFFENFENALIVTTAPAEDSLMHIWKEIQKLQPRYGKGYLTSLQLRMNQKQDEWKVLGFTAGVKAAEIEASASKAQGFHAEHMLIVFDETPGISQAIITAFQNSSVAPHNLIMALGNPDNQFDTLHKFSKLDRVKAVRISGFDHPNVVLKDPNFIPGAQTEQGLKDMLNRYHNNKDDSLYKSRGRGISPTQSKEALIKYEWLVEAINRRKRYEDEEGVIDIRRIPGKKARGVDVANSENGDEGAIARGKGVVLIEVPSFPCPNANKLGSQVNQEMIVEGIADEDVGVDGVGVGAGTVNELKRLGKNVVNLISSEKQEETQEDVPNEDETSDEKRKITPVEKFNNLRSQMWWQFRKDVQTNLAIPNDEQLIRDLLSPMFKTQNGKIIVESKEVIKKRLGRSPNKGDAAVYWNWVRSLRTVAAAVQGMKSKKEPDKKESTEVRRSEPSFRYKPKTGSRHRHSF